MPPLTLRTMVGFIGLSVAIVTTVSVPTGYFLVAYTSVADNLTFVASLNARQVTSVVRGADTRMQDQQARIFEEIALPITDEGPLHRRLYDRDGILVLEDGGQLDKPVLTRSMPVIVAGSTVGRVEVEASLRGVVFRTGLVALLSLVLGATVYVAVRVLPLKVLYRTFDQLEAAQRQLQDYLNLRFDAALNNMSQGLCMFDARGKLTTSNQRFAAMFTIPPDVKITGMTLPEILELSHRRSDVSEVDQELIQSKLSLLVSQDEPGTLTFNRTDGHVVVSRSWWKLA